MGEDIPRHLHAHVRCFLLLAKILDLFTRGDAAFDFVDLLQELLVTHHELYVAVYGPELAKVKPHLLLHITAKLKKMMRNISCFPMERKHKVAKLLAQTCWNQFFEANILKRSLYDLLTNLEELTFPVCSLVSPQEASVLHDGLVGHFGRISHIVKASTSMDSLIGTFSKNDLVLIKTDSGFSFGKAEFFCCYYGARGVKDSELIIVIQAT